MNVSSLGRTLHASFSALSFDATLVAYLLAPALDIAAMGFAWTIHHPMVDVETLLRIAVMATIMACFQAWAHRLTGNFGYGMLILLGLFAVAGSLRWPVLIALAMPLAVMLPGIAGRLRAVRLPPFRRWRFHALLFLAIGFLVSALGQYVDYYDSNLTMVPYIHRDSLYHSAIASMLATNGTVSNGLHGTTPLAYYFFSHLVYGGTSHLLGIPVVEGYGYLTIFLFSPLLISALTITSSAIARIESARDAVQRFLAIAVCLFGFLGYTGRGLFPYYGVFQSFFVSESYLISLIQFAGFLSLFFSRDSRLRITGMFLIAMVMMMTKASVGLICLGLIAYDVLFLGRLGRVALLSIMAGGGVLLAATVMFFLESYLPFIHLGVLEFPRQYGRVTLSPAYRATWSILLFITLHFFFVWAAIAAGFRFRTERAFRDSCHLLGACVLVGLVVLGGFKLMSAEYYFSNVSMFAGLPLLVAFASRRAVGGEFLSDRVGAAFFGCGLVGLLVFAVPAAVASHTGKRAAFSKTSLSDLGPYIQQLREIRDSAASRGYAVYIAKDQRGFWKSEVWCIATPLLIPAIAERPAIFGLPSTSECEKPVGYGYEDFSIEHYRKSSMERLGRDELVAEAKRLKLRGYIDVRKDGRETVDVHE